MPDRWNSTREGRGAGECGRIPGGWNALFRVRCEGSKASESFSPGSLMQIFRCMGIIDHKFGMVDTLWQLQPGP